MHAGKAILMLYAFFTLSHQVWAQQKFHGVRSVGIENAYNSTVFNLDLVPKDFEGDSYTISLGSDFTSSSPITAQKFYPGFRASASYNFVPWNYVLPDGHNAGFMFSSGIILGASRNEDVKDLSPFLGLGFSLQGYMNFKDSPLTFTISFRPTCAMYLDRKVSEEQGSESISSYVVKPFSRAMYCSIFPTLGVKYNFPSFRGYKFAPFSSRTPSFRNLRVGVESNLMINVASYHVRQYRCFDGSKYNYSGPSDYGQLSRELLFSLGLKTGTYSITSLLSGYNFSDEGNYVPLYIRSVWSIANRQNDVFAYSSCLFIQGGSDLNTFKTVTARSGYAMRFGIPGQLRAIFAIFYNFHMNHPMFYDDTLVTPVPVQEKDIFMNYKLNHAIGFCVNIAY